MTDTSPTQTTNAQEQTSKKNFFGGEINFQDKNTFETLDTPAEEISEHSETTDYENILQSTSQPQTTEEPSFVDFDPFGDDEESEMVIEPTIEPDPQPAPTEQPENQSKEDSQPENDFSPNEMESSLKEEILQQKKNSTEATSDEEIFEQEPESTGDEIIDKFLELSTTARKIFQLSEDKSHFKILGGKNSKSTLEYFIYLVEDEENHSDLFIKKVEKHNETSEEEEHLLQRSFNKATQKLEVFVDEVILYEEKVEEKVEEENQRTQILEKLNKFGFLFETYYEDISKTYLEKQEAQEKKKQLHEIFRSF